MKNLGQPKQIWIFSPPRCRMDTFETKASETFAPLWRFNDFSSLVSLSARGPALKFTRSTWVHMSKVPTIQQSPLQQILTGSPRLTLNPLKPKSFLEISDSDSCCGPSTSRGSGDLTPKPERRSKLPDAAPAPAETKKTKFHWAYRVQCTITSCLSSSIFNRIQSSSIS